MDNWDFDDEKSEEDKKKPSVTESRVLELVDKITNDSSTSTQLEPSFVIRKLERELGLSLVSFRSIIVQRLNSKRAQLSPRPTLSRVVVNPVHPTLIYCTLP